MELDNLTSSLLEEYEPESKISLGVVYIIVGLLVMLSNGMVLFVILRTKLLRQPTLWVINHMAFWDFLNGLLIFVIPLPSALLNRFAYPENCIGIVACLLSYLMSLLFFNVATIVIDRLVCLKFPLVYAKMKKRTYVFAVTVVHVLAVCRMLLVAFPDMDFYYNKDAALPLSELGDVRETFFSLSFIAAALIIIIVCSSLIVHTVKQRRKRIGLGGSHCISRNIIKLSIMSVLSAAVFCISFVPLMIVQLLSQSVYENSMPNWVVHLVIMCILSNSIWNVLIYAATYQPFRESLIYIFCRSYYRRMLRKRHGIRSPVERVDTKSNTPPQQSKMETLSADALGNKPSTSGGFKVPNHLFLASGVKRIPSKDLMQIAPL